MMSLQYDSTNDQNRLGASFLRTRGGTGSGAAGVAGALTSAGAVSAEAVYKHNGQGQSIKHCAHTTSKGTFASRASHDSGPTFALGGRPGVPLLLAPSLPDLPPAFLVEPGVGVLLLERLGAGLAAPVSLFLLAAVLSLFFEVTSDFFVGTSLSVELSSTFC